MIKKPFEHSALTKHAVETMSCSSQEMPRKTFLGSTDRKAYTVKTVLQWRDQTMTTVTEIDPWVKNADEIIKEVEETSKHKFANELYKKGLLNV